jgi:hypothetical protein
MNAMQPPLGGRRGCGHEPCTLRLKVFMDAPTPKTEFEFNVEFVKREDGGAFVFGEVRKGVIWEGSSVYLVRKDGSKHKTVCRAIAGLGKRLVEAGGKQGETNVGILIGLPASNVAPGDKLITYEVLPKHGTVSSPEGSPKLATPGIANLPDKVQDNEWQEWWDARVAAIEAVLGKSEDTVGHAVVPFQFGAEMGGAADVIYFRQHIPGPCSVTSELIGCEDQVANRLGNYELMICHRDDDEWGADLISRLAYYTLEAELSPGDTMEIGAATPQGSSIAPLLFLSYARFEVRGKKAGLLLCIGITADELDTCRNGRRAEVEQALKKTGIYPYTDLYRQSVLQPKR